VAARSKAWVCGSSLAGIVGSNPAGAWMSVCVECCVLSGRGLSDGLIPRPEKSYRLWCVAVCDLETSRTRRPWPALGRNATGGEKNHLLDCTFCSIYTFLYNHNLLKERLISGQSNYTDYTSVRVFMCRSSSMFDTVVSKEYKGREE